MKDLVVHRDNKPIYNIVYSDSFDELPDLLIDLGYSNRKICIVTETNVASLYLDAILLSVKDKFASVTAFTFPEGEASKNLDVVRDLYEKLIQEKFDRKDVLVALGGGVVGDLTGFTAATYLRGIDFVQVPTSLLSQVDSSIGGKTGVDFDSYKNMVGAFHMPKLVYINLSAILTLADRQFVSGMGEIVKHGLIKDSDYFKWLSDNEKAINSRQIDVLYEMVRTSNIIKKNVVENDPTEQGERALLNFGHTLGHAIEKYMDFQFMHGECILVGCVLATIISYNKGKISILEKNVIIDGIRKYGHFTLPESMDIDKVIVYTHNDKKAVGNTIKFILLKKIGEAYIDMNVSDDDMRQAMYEYFANYNE